jgi:hypothetical protein
VKDEGTLADMIQLDADQVDRFWKRLDALRAMAEEDREGKGCQEPLSNGS